MSVRPLNLLRCTLLVRFFPPGWGARLYGKQGCLPLHRSSGFDGNQTELPLNDRCAPSQARAKDNEQDEVATMDAS